MQRNRLKNIVNKSKTLNQKIEPFDAFKKSLPEEIEIGDNYRLEAAWKAYGSPKNYQEALWQGLIQPIDENNVKLPSIGYNEETDEYEYLNKGKENETVAKDIRVWDNDVIPFVQELKQGGFIRIYDEEKDCWKYSKSTLNKELVDYLKDGGPTKYTNGLKCSTGECALFSNGELRNSGYMTRGNAWNLQGVDLLYSGYNTDNYPQTYNLLDVVNYNNEASNNFYKNFDSKTLDKDSAYIVNMYYQGSPAQERAYNEGRDKMTGTHTGYVTWNPDTNRWEVTHNIHGTIHVDPFTLIQGGNKKYGITGIFTPRKNNIFNQLRSVLGLGEGGVIESEEVIDSFQKGGKPSVTRNIELLIAYANNQKPPFILRILENDERTYTFPDGKIGTHLLNYDTHNGKTYVFPEIQQDPAGNLWWYKDRALDRALERNNVLEMTPEEAELFVKEYKKYYPNYKPFKMEDGGELSYFKQGGQMNVIPEGALHARKNEMELAKEGTVTHKGIPVVDDDGKQQAEIERNEIIFNKEVTEKLENYCKLFNSDDKTQSEKDEIAIKAGKLLAKQIIENTDDRTGLIEEVANKK